MTPLFGYLEPDDDPRVGSRDRDRSRAHIGVAYGESPAFQAVAESAVGWEGEAAFVPHPRLSVDQPVPVMAGTPVSRRRRRRQPPRSAWPEVIGSLFGALTAVTVAAVCVLGWAFSYDPLWALAYSRVPRALSQLWPVIVYGPWLAGCLSVLRAALHGRQPLHSWVVVVLFSTLATGLCVADVSRTLPDLVVAGLPPLTAVISLHQLVRQLTAVRGTGRRPGRQAAHKFPH